MSAPGTTPQSPVRLDKWLWAARFFKTRAVARAAIQGGKVQLNGARSKPGKTLSLGDELRIQRGEEVLLVKVLVISDRRGPATLAQTLYEESPDSRARREQLAAQRSVERAAHAGRERRPDKRQRRQIIQFRDKQGK
jgi:ribosome-associated heat shock protein Hsp15